MNARIQLIKPSHSILWLLLSLYSIGSTAALVSLDDPTLGPGTITRDTTTHLEWLDLSLTSNMTWNAAEANYSSLGFRHATVSEVTSLFISAEIPNIDTGTSSANYLPSLALQDLITCFAGFNSTTGSSTCGSFGFTAIDEGLSELSWINRNDTALESTVIVNSNNFIGTNPDAFDTFSHSTRSHWMVRPVPIPMPAILLISAISSLLLAKRRVT